MDIDLVILTYNEVDGLKHYLPLIVQMATDNAIRRVFSVDGGSTDGSLELYRQQGMPYVVQDKKGRGEAFKLAFRHSDAEALIFFSPDGNEDITDIKPLIHLLEKGAEMVIASRMMKGAHNEEDEQFWRWRKWVNQLFTLAANLFWNRSGVYVTDAINGFRGIRRSTWEALRVDASDYAVEYQSTIRALKRRRRIAEWPTYESPRIGGESYAKSWPTGVRFIKLLLHELLMGRRF